jgi:hypothetical protein
VSPTPYLPITWGSKEAHRRSPINLIDDQAVGPSTSAQHRLHLGGCLNVCSEGLRTAVITGMGRPGEGLLDSCGFSPCGSQ